MNSEPNVESMRRRFSRSLIGRWTTQTGTFDMIAQHWEIRADGSGLFVDTGSCGHPRSETRFEWRQRAERVFELRLIEFIALQSGQESELADEEREWQQVPYDFIRFDSDVAPFVGLVDTSSDVDNGFYGSLSPMMYAGPISDTCDDEQRP